MDSILRRMAMTVAAAALGIATAGAARAVDYSAPQPLQAGAQAPIQKAATKDRIPINDSIL